MAGRARWPKRAPGTRPSRGRDRPRPTAAPAAGGRGARGRRRLARLPGGRREGDRAAPPVGGDARLVPKPPRERPSASRRSRRWPVPPHTGRVRSSTLCRMNSVLPRPGAGTRARPHRAAATTAPPHVRSGAARPRHDPSRSRAPGSGGRDHPSRRHVPAGGPVRGRRSPGFGGPVAIRSAGRRPACSGREGGPPRDDAPGRVPPEGPPGASGRAPRSRSGGPALRPCPTRPRNRTPGAGFGRRRSRGQASPTVAWRGRRSPAFGTPCPRPVPPLRRGLGAGPARAAGRRRSPGRRNGAPSPERRAGPGPDPLGPGGGGGRRRRLAARRRADRRVAPTLDRGRRRGDPLDPLGLPPDSRLSRSGEGRPPPVPGAPRRAGRSSRGGPWSAAPRPAAGPPIRSVCRARPSGGVPRPRVGRRRPSSPGPGGRTVGRTRRPPRARAVGVRASSSPPVAPVPARRCRRSGRGRGRIDGAAPGPVGPGRGRRTREPSRPASRRTTTRTGRPARRSAVVPGRAGRSGGAPPAPPATACLEGFPPPGAPAVASRRASPGPSDAEGAASPARAATRGAVAGPTGRHRPPPRRPAAASTRRADPPATRARGILDSGRSSSMVSCPTSRSRPAISASQARRSGVVGRPPARSPAPRLFTRVRGSSRDCRAGVPAGSGPSRRPGAPRRLGARLHRAGSVPGRPSSLVARSAYPVSPPVPVRLSGVSPCSPSPLS